MCAAKPPKPKAPPKPPTERDAQMDGLQQKRDAAGRASLYGGHEATLGGQETRDGTSPRLSGS